MVIPRGRPVVHSRDPGRFSVVMVCGQCVFFSVNVFRAALYSISGLSIISFSLLESRGSGNFIQDSSWS